MPDFLPVIPINSAFSSPPRQSKGSRDDSDVTSTAESSKTLSLARKRTQSVSSPSTLSSGPYTGSLFQAGLEDREENPAAVRTRPCSYKEASTQRMHSVGRHEEALRTQAPPLTQLLEALKESQEGLTQAWDTLRFYRFTSLPYFPQARKEWILRYQACIAEVQKTQEQYHNAVRGLLPYAGGQETLSQADSLLVQIRNLNQAPSSWPTPSAFRKKLEKFFAWIQGTTPVDIHAECKKNLAQLQSSLNKLSTKVSTKVAEQTFITSHHTQTKTEIEDRLKNIKWSMPTATSLRNKFYQEAQTAIAIIEESLLQSENQPFLTLNDSERRAAGLIQKLATDLVDWSMTNEERNWREGGSLPVCPSQKLLPLLDGADTILTCQKSLASFLSAAKEYLIWSKNQRNQESGQPELGGSAFLEGFLQGQDRQTGLPPYQYKGWPVIVYKMEDGDLEKNTTHSQEQIVSESIRKGILPVFIRLEVNSLHYVVSAAPHTPSFQEKLQNELNAYMESPHHKNKNVKRPRVLLRKLSPFDVKLAKSSEHENNCAAHSMWGSLHSQFYFEE